jgi:sterol 3beta-glucosyltransferase
MEKAGRNPTRMVSEMSKHVLPLAVDVSQRARLACRDTDLIVHSFLLTQAGHDVALELRVPDISAQLFPVFSTTGEFPSPVFPDLPFGKSYRKASHWVTTRIFRHGGQLLYWWVRRSHPQLPAITEWPFSKRNVPPSPILYGFSPAVIPRPADWPAEAHVTGYWFLDDPGGWRPPESLLGFFDDGPAPVCVALGSSIGAGASRIGKIALEALRFTGQRGIIVGRNLGLMDLADDVLVVEYAPYAWLFPRVKWVVHHGGAGTTGKALRAGVPSIVIPFTSDQPFWGRRVHALGAGPKPIPAQKLSMPALVEAIGAVASSSEIPTRAREVAERMGPEDGVARAIEIILRRAKSVA